MKQGNLDCELFYVGSTTKPSHLEECLESPSYLMTLTEMQYNSLSNQCQSREVKFPWHLWSFVQANKNKAELHSKLKYCTWWEQEGGTTVQHWHYEACPKPAGFSTGPDVEPRMPAASLAAGSYFFHSYLSFMGQFLSSPYSTKWKHWFFRCRKRNLPCY